MESTCSSFSEYFRGRQWLAFSHQPLATFFQHHSVIDGKPTCASIAARCFCSS